MRIEDGTTPQLREINWLLLGASHKTKNKLVEGVLLGLPTQLEQENRSRKALQQAYLLQVARPSCSFHLGEALRACLAGRNQRLARMLLPKRGQPVETHR